MTKIMDTKIVDLTAEDIQKLTKPIGIEGMPYPMVMYAAGADGRMEQKIGVIDSLANAMKVYTERPLEEVQGKLFREMPIPSMLLMLRDLLAKQAPTSRNRIFTVFGDPAFGKSFLFKSVSSIVHPQGAIQVDCGGMNMREIFFRTVIDYGAGVKEVLDQRLAEGKISQATIDYLNKEFPDSVVSKDGKSVIDWDRVGAPGKDEDRGAAFERAAKVMNTVYDRENITHLNNSFGIKTVPGEFFEALWSGRPLFLDEFNKSKRGTLDSWQTALQFLNGEEDSVTIYNPMSQSAGDDTMKAITVTRADMKPGFIVGVAGNEGKDGDTTQELSESMMTRLNPMYVGNPTIRDWEHRISQVWTGLPLVTLYSIFQDFATDKPEEFTQFLLDLRKMGLSNQEIAAIPNKEIYFLQNWPDTLLAVRQVATQQNFRYQLGNPESKLFEEDAYKDLSDEINSDASAKQIGVSFRKIIADHNKAVEGAPEARESKGLTPNIQGALDPAHLSGMGVPEAGWHHFGANLAAAMIEDIINVTKDMPLTRAALIDECKANGIMPEVYQEARPSDAVKPLSDLMKYDELRDMGGTDELRAMQGVVMMALRSRYADLTASDDQIVPLENLGRAMQSLREAKETTTKQFIVPNDDLNLVKAQPIIAAEAISSYTELDGPAREGVDFRSVLAAMAIPDYAEQNRGNIWPNDLMEMLERSGEPLPDEADTAEMEIYNMLMGKSGNGFNLGIASAVNTAGDPVYLYILEDKEAGQTLVIGPEKISVQLDSVLRRNGVSYLIKSDEKTGEKIDEFLTEGTRGRQKNGSIPKGTSNDVTESLINAFGRVSAFPEKYVKGDVIIEGTTLGSIIVDADDAPVVYTRFVKSPKVGM